MEDVKKMHSMDELQEMMEIRKKMDKLLARYNEIAGKPSGDVPFASPSEKTSKPEPVDLSPAKPKVEKKEEKAEEKKKKPQIDKIEQPKEELAKEAEKEPEKEPESKKEEPKPSEAKDGMKTSDKLSAILKDAGKPMSFDKIYDALEKSGYGLPKDKPKLVVRKVLYNPKNFKRVGKGDFDIAG